MKIRSLFWSDSFFFNYFSLSIQKHVATPVKFLWNTVFAISEAMINSTSATQEFTNLGLPELSLLNTEQVLEGLIQYHIRSHVAIFC